MNIKKLFVGAGAITGYIVGLIGVFIGILTVKGEAKIEYRWIILIVACLLFIVSVSVIVFINAKKILKEGIRYPIYSCDSEDDNVFLYIKYSKVFRIGALVSIYIQNNNISKRMGIGSVHNIDMEGEKYTEIQVIIIYYPYNDTFEKARQKNKRVLDSMYIAPIIIEDDVLNFRV